MPKNNDKDLPGTLQRSPAKAKRTYRKAHDAAVDSYGEGERAHRTAFSALKHSFEKKGDHWEPKKRKGPSDPQAVESRVEEFREQEGPGEDQPTPASRIDEGRTGSLDLDDAEARSDIARFLDPSAFPADRDGLVANAESNNAPEVVLERLKALPGGRTYDALPDVWAALGGTVEHRF